MEWTLTANEPGKVCLMQGNEAIVRGALEAGINFASSYPGSPSSQVLGMLGNVAEERGFYAQWAINEISALQGCMGASFANARAICIMKQNGLLVSADALFCGVQGGVKGGLVLITSDDPDAHSSTNEFDSRNFAPAAEVIMLEPMTMQETKDMIPYAFELSERHNQLVIVRVTTRICHGRGNVVLGELPEKPHPIQAVDEWDRMNCVCYEHQATLNKLKAVQEEFETCPFNTYQGPEKAEKLIISSGTGKLYAKEAISRLGVSDTVGLLALGTLWPLPEKTITSYMKEAKEVLVLEEVDPYLMTQVEAIAGRYGLNIKFSDRGTNVGELSPDEVLKAISALTKVAIPEKRVKLNEQGEKEPLIRRELTFCAGCPHRATFYLLKKALRSEKIPGISIGDIGCYFMAGGEAGFFGYQVCNAMGSGINVAQGLGQLTSYGLNQKVVTMCGDSTFFHTVMPGLLNASYHNSDMLMIVLDNSATAMTGFQPHPGTGITAMGKTVEPMSIEAICLAMGCSVTIADPFDIENTQQILLDLLQQKGLKVLIMKQPCATLKSKQGGPKKTVRVNQEKCLGDGCGCDKFCSRVWGCPGNSWDFEKGKAVIDPVSCVGCGVCAKLCPAGAIEVEGGAEE